MPPLTLSNVEYTDALAATRAFLKLLPRRFLTPHGMEPTGKPGANVVQEKGQTT